MPETPRLGLPLIAAGQSQKDVTHNEAVLALDRMVALAAVSRTQLAPPVTASPGEIQIVPAGGAAAWGHPEGSLAQWQGAGWQSQMPRNGQLALVEDEGLMLLYRNGWQALFPVLGLQIDGRTVLAAPPVAISSPAGGTTVDVEARVVLNALLSALVDQGIIAD
jgi:hypothetical protein